MVSHPETDSDSPIGSDRDRGRDKTCMETMILVWVIGLLNFCMELFDDEETINPFFFFL